MKKSKWPLWVGISAAVLVISIVSAIIYFGGWFSTKSGSGTLIKGEAKDLSIKVTEPVDETISTTTAPTSSATPVPANDSKIINLWSYTDELPMAAEKFMSTHPDFEYEFCTTLVATDSGGYQSAIDNALAAGGINAPDIYAVELGFVYKYVNGEALWYAGKYEDLGIDVNQAVIDSAINPYQVSVGTRAYDDSIVGLGYMSCSSCLFYRASIAEEVFGTSDPAEINKILGGGTGSLDDFWAASEKLSKAGYKTIASTDDLWMMYNASSPDGWIKDDKLYISPERESFLDAAKDAYDKDIITSEMQWTADWFDSFSANPDKQVFCLLGPKWFLDYTLMPNSSGFCMHDNADSEGDWRVCNAPIDFSWSGSWVIPSIYATNADDEKKAAIAEFLYWLTLDDTTEGYQYYLFSDYEYPNAPASTNILNQVECTEEFVGGQDVFEYFAIANDAQVYNNISPYDEIIDMYWLDAVRQYANGDLTRDQAIEVFKENVEYATGISS